MSAPVTVDQASLERMSEKDKAELREFINNQQQRARVQSQTHGLTEICWKKCVTGPAKSNTLDKTEESCMNNCVDRFLDVAIFTTGHLSKLRQ